MLNSKSCKKIIAAMLSVCMLPSFAAYAAEGGYAAEIIKITENDKISDISVKCSGDVVTVSGKSAEIFGSNVTMCVYGGNTNEVVCIDETTTDIKRKFSMKFKAGNNTNFTVKLAGTDTDVLTANVIVTENTALKRVKTLETLMGDVKTLLESCAEKGIRADYENMYYNLIMRSVEVMYDEAGINSDANIIDKNIETAYTYYNIITDNLNAYLSGEKTPVTVPMPEPDEIEVSGKSFLGTAIADGKNVTRPVFLSGYNQGSEKRDETENMRGFGQNFTSEELAFKDVVGKIGGPACWSLNPGVNGLPDADLTVTSEEKYKGNSSLKIVNRTAASENKKGYLWQSIILKPNTTYRFGGRYKGNGNRARVCFGYGNTVANLGSAANWRNFNYSCTTSASEAGQCIIAIYLDDVIDALYLDDMYLYEGNSTVNKLKNGGFEYTFEPSADSEYGVCIPVVEEYKEKLDRYYDNKVSAVLTSALYGIGALLDDYPSAKEDRKYASSQLPYNITHDRVTELTKLYYETVLPIIKDCKALKAVQITNEPMFSTCGSEYYREQWSEWLESKYKTISALNKIYGSNYKSFGEIAMNDNFYDRDVSYNDWREFNDSVMTEYNRVLSEKIHELAPGKAVMTKIMMYTADYYQSRFLNNGTNYEDMSKYFDVNGTDAWAYLGGRDTIINKNMWYDLQTSVLNRPIVNTENHVITDSKQIDYSKNYADFITADLWQGAIHGLGANLTWLWGKSDNLEDGYFRNTTMQYRLDCMISGGKTTYDINRLSEEIYEMANKHPDAALLYSYTSCGYDLYYANQDMAKLYQKLIYSGAKPSFVTEENFDGIKECDTLIIPNIKYVPEKTLDLIINEVNNGKKVIVIGSDSLKYDDNELPANADKREYIMSHAEVYSVSETDVVVNELEKCKDFGKITLTSNGKKTDNVEISSIRSGNKIIINLCSYNTSGNIDANISYNGKDIAAYKNLLTDETFYGSSVILKPMSPVMLSFDINEFAFGTNDNWITASLSGKFREMRGEQAFVCAAVYNRDGRLTALQCNKTDVTGEEQEFSCSVPAESVEEGGYVKAFLWTHEGKPMAVSGEYRKE